MTCKDGSPEDTSRLTFWTSAPSSSWLIFTSIPVRSLNGLRLAAIADVGAVFSEIKLSVIPLYCFQPSPPPCEPCSPQPARPRSDAPASPAPDILRKSLRLNPPEIFIRLIPQLSWLPAPSWPPATVPYFG